ncbi:hypothetical protein GBA52_028894 [Prunus armeniaca]|nr:hypothetical protein GBA52_028894 [Prunus armeniaca]
MEHLLLICTISPSASQGFALKLAPPSQRAGPIQTLSSPLRERKARAGYLLRHPLNLCPNHMNHHQEPVGMINLVLRGQSSISSSYMHGALLQKLHPVLHFQGISFKHNICLACLEQVQLHSNITWYCQQTFTFQTLLNLKVLLSRFLSTLVVNNSLFLKRASISVSLYVRHACTGWSFSEATGFMDK